MSKTTITINGEECVILPAPKGAFLVKDGLQYPYFVEYAAISTYDSPYPNVYGIELNESYAEIQDKQYGEKLKSDVWSGILENLQKSAIESGEDDMRRFVTETYQAFRTHDTPMDLSAIEWFKEKFKEHNITKADFDVFA